MFPFSARYLQTLQTDALTPDCFFFDCLWASSRHLSFSNGSTLLSVFLFLILWFAFFTIMEHLYLVMITPACVTSHGSSCSSLFSDLPPQTASTCASFFLLLLLRFPLLRFSDCSFSVNGQELRHSVLQSSPLLAERRLLALNRFSKWRHHIRICS